MLKIKPSQAEKVNFLKWCPVGDSNSRPFD